MNRILNLKTFWFVFVALMVVLSLNFLETEEMVAAPIQVIEQREGQVISTARIEKTGNESGPLLPVHNMAKPSSHLISAKLLEVYGTNQSMRAFVEYALQHPEAGGLFYAYKVLNECRSHELVGAGSKLPEYVPDDDPVLYQRKADAAERLRRRCGDFMPHEWGSQRTAQIWRNGLSTDPLVQAQQRHAAAIAESKHSPEHFDERRKALTNLLALGDPLLLDDLGLRLALHTEDGRKGLWLGGKFWPLDGETDVGAAVYLLPCAAGLSCDGTDYPIAWACASGGECPAGRFQRTEKMLEDVPGAYPRVLQVYEGMRQALAAADASYFLRPQ